MPNSEITPAKSRDVAPKKHKETGTVPLTLWQARFIEWMARRLSRPSLVAQVKQANYFSHQCGELEPGERIEERDLKRFKNRAEHKEYRALVENGGVKAARAMMRHRLPTAVELHFTNMIKADAAGDYNAVARFTNPLIDRVEPRMGPNMLQPNTAIQVNLTVEQAHNLADETPEAECEVISEAVFTTKD